MLCRGSAGVGWSSRWNRLLLATVTGIEFPLARIVNSILSVVIGLAGVFGSDLKSNAVGDEFSPSSWKAPSSQRRLTSSRRSIETDGWSLLSVSLTEGVFSEKRE